jgi:parvulin-like peptidyl-prolyl isomerase
MKSQIAPRPDQRRSSRSAKPSKSKHYVKQTAHVEARRDGKPLIFGWGEHLSRTEKTQIQRRAIWSLTILIGVAIVAIFVGFWMNINIVVPNEPITSVNGQNIPQSDYRKLVAFKAQETNNEINGPHGLTIQKDSLSTTVANDQVKIDSLKTQLSSTIDPAKEASIQQQIDAAQKVHDSDNARLSTLQTNITTAQTDDTQSQIANESVEWLQDDLIIRQWMAQQSAAIQAKIEPSTSQVNQAMNQLIAEIPKGSTYNQILSKYGVSDSDMRVMMALKLRRDNMNNYQRSLITSPTRQVKARAITLSTPSDAQNALNQLKKGADFTTLAKTKSVDTTTKSSGGELGWLVRWQYTVNNSSNIRGTGAIDNWLFDPARKVNQLSPILTENGTYHIVQVEAIDPSRKVDDPHILSTLRADDTPLIAWLNSQEVNAHITPGDSNKEFDPLNMPQDIPTSPPGSTPPDSSGVPSGSGLPGGSSIPASGAP